MALSEIILVIWYNDISLFNMCFSSNKIFLINLHKAIWTLILWSFNAIIKNNSFTLSLKIFLSFTNALHIFIKFILWWNFLWKAKDSNILYNLSLSLKFSLYKWSITFPSTLELTVLTFEIRSKQKVIHCGIMDLYITVFSYKL